MVPEFKAEVCLGEARKLHQASCLPKLSPSLTFISIHPDADPTSHKTASTSRAFHHAESIRLLLGLSGTDTFFLTAANMGSNAHAFKEWASGEGLTRSASLDQIKGSVIGIDAEDYLQSFSVQRREPLLPALGGLPFSLDTRVDDDVRNLREAGIEPIFIFNGLELACKDRASVLKESRKMASILSDAWTIYDLGKGEEAVNMFGRASKRIILD